MDIVFHPLVIYFSGYDPKDDRNSQLHSDYLHLHYETIIDRHFNKAIFLENIINPAVVKDVIIPSIRKYLPPGYKEVPENTDLLFPANPQPPLLPNVQNVRENGPG